MKKIMFLLIVLGFANTYSADSADRQPPKRSLSLQLPGGLAAKRLGIASRIPNSEDLKARKAAEEAKRDAEKKAYLEKVATELNLLLQEIAQKNGTELLPADIPVTYYRDNGRKLYLEIDIKEFGKFDFLNQERVIATITRIHDDLLNNLPKNHRVRWVDGDDFEDDDTHKWEDTDWNDKQDLEEWYIPNSFPPKAMFEMHGYPISFAQRKSNSTAKAGNEKMWYKTLSQEKKDQYQKMEMGNRFAKTGDGQPELEVFDQMETEGTRTSGEWRDKSVYYRLEQLKRMYPELFKK